MLVTAAYSTVGMPKSATRCIATSFMIEIYIQHLTAQQTIRLLLAFRAGSYYVRPTQCYDTLAGWVHQALDDLVAKGLGLDEVTSSMIYKPGVSRLAGD